MRPMLARTLGPNYTHFPCYVQPKLNGIRALYQRGVFQSRDEKIWNDKILAHLTHQLFPTVTNHYKDLILDGELYVHGWRLQRINAAVAVNRKEPTPDTPHVCFHVFDIVNPRLDFSDRWLEFYHALTAANLSHIIPVPTALCSNRHEIDQYFHLYTSQGFEGIILRPNGLYEFGEHMGRNGDMTQFRSRNLWKYKAWEDGEYQCVAMTQGEGKADIGIGALVLARDGCFDHSDHFLGPTFKVGTGFTDEDRIEFSRNPPLGKLIKIRYLNLTADGIPFNPSFLCVIP